MFADVELGRGNKFESVLDACPVCKSKFRKLKRRAGDAVVWECPFCGYRVYVMEVVSDD